MIGATVVVAVLIVGISIWAMRAQRNKEVVVAIVGASTAIAVAIIGNTLTQSATAQREISESHRLHKVGVYTEFVALIVDAFSSVKSLELEEVVSEVERQRRTDELVRSFVPRYFEFSKKLVVWGSPEVIRTYKKFWNLTQTARAGDVKQSVAILLAADDVIRAMRSDLDLPNRGLRRGDLIALYLSDPETVGASR